ncbi:class I SAM-dependent methyltransferase [Janibacter alkaliphilus]|uniref:Cyclopropane-fatty-acyl-phospholipid synthase n=1 Tax=Janibacter alkaliphilus TaxID=1069963 RepID=A0A852XAX0_9MICO|nr:class I SAM-dependent methyltransferase [Janibacter alkaliphilus]NYG35681.1 cyclopropane-fatty-acyl-phospholipid synthase [Janibacter alkaliphilus]
MTRLEDSPTDAGETMSVGEIIGAFLPPDVPLRFRAYDGSTFGPADSPLELEVVSPRALQYVVTAPGDLGLARAYLMGELVVHGVHPGSPHDLFAALEQVRKETATRPDARTLARIARSLGLESLHRPPVPEMEVAPGWQRYLKGLRRHSKERDSEVVSYHYDISNRFYELVLGPSMTYTCACYPEPGASLETAQENKYRLVFDKLRLQPGQRLLDVGCGWGQMVLYAARRGVHALGVTLSEQQAAWAQEQIAKEGLSHLAEVRLQDYRDVSESGFDAVSSIGMTEHIGQKQYPAYFGAMLARLRPGGLFLNHCITRRDNTDTSGAGQFINRYVFPDGELCGAGTVLGAIQDAGMPVLHEESLRPHYALTLRDWCANLTEHWEECVAEVGEPTARLWGLYMGACQYGFEDGRVELHHVLAVAPGGEELPLRPWWAA